MASRPRNRKKQVAVLVAGLVLTGGGAFAWFGATSTASGASTASTSAAGLTINQTAVTGLWAGGAKTLSGTFSNPNPGSVRVTSVTATLGAVTKSPTAPAGKCDATDFTLTNATVAVNQDVPTGSAKGTWSGPVLSMVKKTTDQDACLGATVTVNYTSA